MTSNPRCTVMPPSLAYQPADMLVMVGTPLCIALEPQHVCSVAGTCTAMQHVLADTVAELRQAHWHRVMRDAPPTSPLAALVAQVDKERTSAAAAGDTDQRARHKALVRAAGRAALEDTLHNQTREGPEDSKLATMTLESLTAEWAAYAEVFGTNGMAAGGGRSATVASDSEAAKAPVPVRCGGIGASIAAAAAVVLVLVVVQQRGGVRK